MSEVKPNTTKKVIVRLPKELLASNQFHVVLLQLHEDKSSRITGTMTVADGRSRELKAELEGSRKGNVLRLWNPWASRMNTEGISVVLAKDGSFTMYPSPGSSGSALHFKPSSLRKYRAAVKQRWS